MNRTKIMMIVIVFILVIPFFANAQSLYGDFVKPPTDIQRGFYMGTDLSLLFFLGSNGAIKNPGYALTFFTGVDIFKYLAFEAMFRSGISSALKIDPLEGGIYSFFGNGLFRGFYPLGRFYPFIDIGGGIVFTHPEYDFGLGKTWNMEIGWGVEYFTYQRQFSIKFRNSYVHIPGRIPEAMTLGLSLKYTF